MNLPRSTDAAILAKAGRSGAAEIFAERGFELPDVHPREGRGLPVPEQVYRRRLAQHGAAVAPADALISFLGAGHGPAFIPPSLAGAMEVAATAARREPRAWGGRFAARLASLTGMAAVLPAALTAREAAAALVRLIAETRPGGREVLLAGTLPLAFEKALRRSLDRAGFLHRFLGWDEGIVSTGELLANFASSESASAAGIAAVVVASPNALGCIEPLSEIGQIVHHRGALFIPVVDPVTLALLRTPGEAAANFSCGSLRSLGLAGKGMGDAWFLAAGERQRDYLAPDLLDPVLGPDPAARAAGTMGEVAAFVDGLGADGLAALASIRFRYARFLHDALGQITGFRPAFPDKIPFFDEFVFRTPLPVEEIVAELEEQGIVAGLPVRLPQPGGGNGLLLSVSERRTLREMEYFLKALKQIRDRNAGRILGADL